MAQDWSHGHSNHRLAGKFPDTRKQQLCCHHCASVGTGSYLLLPAPIQPRLDIPAHISQQQQQQLSSDTEFGELSILP